MAKRLRYTVEQALALDPSKLTERELRAAVQALSDASRKRVQRALKKGGELPPAIEKIAQQGKISTRGKKLPQLRSEYARAYRQFSSVSGSLRGYEGFKKQVRQTLSTSRNISVTDEEWDRFWRAYENMKDIDDRVKSGAYKYAILEKIAQAVKVEVDVEAVSNMVAKRVEDVEKIYEEYQLRQLDEEDDDYGDLPF